MSLNGIVRNYRQLQEEFSRLAALEFIDEQEDQEGEDCND